MSNKTEKQEMLSELMARVDAENPDPKDVLRLKSIFANNPTFFRSRLDLACAAVEKALSATSNNESVKAVGQMNVDAVKQELGYNTSSPIEQLLIDQAALCWLRTMLTEQHYSNNTINGSIRVIDFWERRLSCVHMRFTRSIEALARIRKIAPKMIQVNIAAEGGKQMNIQTPSADQNRKD